MKVVRTMVGHIAVTALLAGLVVVAVAAPVWAAEEAAHAVAHEQAADENPNPLVFDPDLAIFTAIVFLILLGILGKFAWPQITAALDERERKIADNIAAAEAKHEEAKLLLAEHEAKLAAAAGEVRELFEQARREAEQTKGRIVAEAKGAAEEERGRAVREIERAKDAAMHDLAITSANMAIDLTSKVVREQLSKDKQDQIVREALGKLAATEPSQN